MSRVYIAELVTTKANRIRLLKAVYTMHEASYELKYRVSDYSTLHKLTDLLIC